MEQEQWTPEQFSTYYAKKKGSDAQATRLKYGNKHTEVDGIRFDSKKEAEYYGKLKLRVRIGQLLKFDRQVAYQLIVNGQKITEYRADFVLYHPDGTVTVVDVKSEATEGLATFRIKKALMWAILAIKIQIVCKEYSPFVKK